MDDSKPRAIEQHKQKPPSHVWVWDLPTRAFHWALVTAIAVAWFSAGVSSRVHEPAGYLILGLILFRLWWGLAGSKHARFSDFISMPGRIWRFLRDIKTGRSKRHLGHNPAGAAMIVTLLGLIFIISISGWMMLTRRYFGVEWVENIHTYVTYILLAVIPLHVAGVLLSSRLNRENLIWAMITGRKQAEPGQELRNEKSGLNDLLLDRIRSVEAFGVMMALILVATVTWNEVDRQKKTKTATTTEPQSTVRNPPEDVLLTLARALASKHGNKLDARQFAHTTCKAIVLSKRQDFDPVVNLISNWKPQVIRELQRVLRKERYYNGRIDGIIGKKSILALAAFSKSDRREEMCLPLAGR